MSFVRRVRSSSDRRVIYIKINEKGTSILEEMDEPVLHVLKRLLGHLTKNELSEISDLMVKARKFSENGTLKWKFNASAPNSHGCNDVAPTIYDVDNNGTQEDRHVWLMQYG